MKNKCEHESIYFQEENIPVDWTIENLDDEPTVVEINQYHPQYITSLLYKCENCDMLGEMQMIYTNMEWSDGNE